MIRNPLPGSFNVKPLKRKRTEAQAWLDDYKKGADVDAAPSKVTKITSLIEDAAEGEVYEKAPPEEDL